MKAKDLMIGNWVECVDSTHKKKVYAKVCAIEEGQTCILVEKDNSNWFLDISLLKPIPFEKIHLTKNGFEPVDEDDRVFVFSDGYRIEIVFDDGIPQMSIPPSVYMTIEFAEKELDMPIKYVHELQQAMRLFEIEKEIKL